MRQLTAGVLVALILLGGQTTTATADVTADQVRDAIDRGVEYLKREQNKKDGTWPDHVGLPSAMTGLCTLALINSGVPVDDPAVKSGLAYLRKQSPQMTYSVALQTMALAAAKNKADLLLLRKNVAWFEEHQIRAGGNKGAWGYPNTGGDNSNTQFAMLALHEAERVGVPVKDQTWRLALGYWQRTQNADGAWGYYEGARSTGSMTCAGIGAVIIAADRLKAADAKVEGEEIICCGAQEQDDTVDRALRWLGRNFTVSANPGAPAAHTWWLYYLYGVERVGRLSNQRFIGDHDWYREGAEVLVRDQEQLSGYWKGSGHAEDNTHVATSLALLFLSKGRRPVLAAKLMHEPLDDWNHHRSDLANLTTYAEMKWEKDLTWQVIDARAATADDLIEAPVLWISGHRVPIFSDEQVQRLREYINRGGFIFAETACGGEEFDAGFRELMARVFPEPEYKLNLLAAEHPVWSAEEKVDPEYMLPLYGIDVGCRTSVVYCPQNLGGLWELSRPGREVTFPAKVQAQIDAANAIGINVMAYATNREPRYKLDTPQIVQDAAPHDQAERAKLYIGKIRHNGGWNVAPGALPNLMRSLSHTAGLRISMEQHELALTEEQLFDHSLIFMHGRNDFRFSVEERKALKEFVGRGGVVMADAVCASDQFAAAFRREMLAVFPTKPLEPIPADHAMFTSEFGGFDLAQVERRDPRRRGTDGPLQANKVTGPPELEGLKFENRYGVIFSPLDLSCALENHESIECPGYTRQDAARIGLNLVLYSLQ